VRAKLVSVGVAVVVAGVLAADGPSATAAKFTATIAAKPGVSGIFLGTLEQRTLTWRVHVHGIAGRVALQVRSGARAAVLCAKCAADARGSATVSSALVTALRGGAAYLDVRPAGSKTAAAKPRIAAGTPTLTITAPKDGDSITLPAEISYRVSSFQVGAPPLGHIEVTAPGVPAIEIELRAASGTATLPAAKFLSGRRDVTFALATADRVALPNAEARVTVRDLTMAGKR
jgi:hypothetical protein